MPPSSDAGGPRIAVVAQGDPEDPRSWSGVMAGISRGLAEAGATPVPIDARPPGSAKAVSRLARSWTWETTSRIYPALSSAWASLRLARAKVDGVLSIGSGFVLRTGLPVATLEDMTVVQAVARGFSAADAPPPAAIARWRNRQARIYAGARACCATSHWAADSVRDDYGIDPGKIHVVGFGRNFDPVPDPARDWTIPRFLFLGVDWERKGGPAVLEAFGRLRAEVPGARLDLVGGHPPIAAAGVTGHGRIALSDPDGRTRIEALLGAATCLVLPSALEPFGIAYVDAGAAGTPSIGTTEGGAADAIGDGGVLVAPGEPEALLAAMRRLADPAVAKRLGGLAKVHSELLTWPRVGARILTALDLPGDHTGTVSFL